MSIQNRVSVFVKDQPGWQYCDQCILNAIGQASRAMVNEATRKLARAGRVLHFAQSKGKCALCKCRRTVIYST